MDPQCCSIDPLRTMIRVEAKDINCKTVYSTFSYGFLTLGPMAGHKPGCTVSGEKKCL